MRAALLARVSDVSQAGADRMSLPMQRERMERFAEERGWPVVRVFEVPGESAFGERRPQFFAAIEAAERGEFEVLLIYDVSRFARNQWVLHDTLRRLRLAGVRVVEVLLGADLGEDMMVTGIRGAMAEAESRRQGQRIRDAKEHRWRLGLHNGDVPFGYRRGETTSAPLEVVREEAGAVRLVFERYASGVGYLAIASELNRGGFKPRSKRGLVAFTVSSVQSLVENAFYAGFVVHRGSGARGARGDYRGGVVPGGAVAGAPARGEGWPFVWGDAGGVAGLRWVRGSGVVEPVGAGAAFLLLGAVEGAGPGVRVAGAEVEGGGCGCDRGGCGVFDGCEGWLDGAGRTDGSPG